MVDRGDVAGATSSASSKLVHGGLRYLELGDVKTVREAHSERRANAEVIAPHLVRPLRFLVPVTEQSPQPLWKVRAGVFVYATLSRFRDGHSGRIGLSRARQYVPDLSLEGVRGVVAYHDHQTNDARLTLAALQGAAAHGAIVATHCEVLELRKQRDRVVGAELRDRLTGTSLSVNATAVVNATGPWIDRLRALESPTAGTSVRLAKGAHLTLTGGAGWTAAVTTPLEDGRVSFAIPWEGMLLLGTTDEPYDGDPSDVRATDADARQILSEAGRSIVPEALSPDRIRSRFAGVRVLPLSPGDTSHAHRETVIRRGPGGMVSVAGGKLTTWRLIGARAAAAALPSIGTTQPPPRPLPGSARLELAEQVLAQAHPRADPVVRRHLARHYGLFAAAVLDAGRWERIDPSGPDVWAQVRHAREHEWAATAEDIVHTRTTLAVRGLDTPAVREQITAELDCLA